MNQYSPLGKSSLLQFLEGNQWRHWNLPSTKLSEYFGTIVVIFLSMNNPMKPTIEPRSCRHLFLLPFHFKLKTIKIRSVTLYLIVEMIGLHPDQFLTCNSEQIHLEEWRTLTSLWDGFKVGFFFRFLNLLWIAFLLYFPTYFIVNYWKLAVPNHSHVHPKTPHIDRRFWEYLYAVLFLASRFFLWGKKCRHHFLTANNFQTFFCKFFGSSNNSCEIFRKPNWTYAIYLIIPL